MISSNTFTVIMTRPFNGLTVTKHFGNIGEMDMDATFSKVEKDLIKLYEQETKRIESKKLPILSECKNCQVLKSKYISTWRLSL